MLLPVEIEEMHEGRLWRLGRRSYYAQSTPNGASNAGIILGDDATLLVDTRLTPDLGRDLGAVARRLAGDASRPLWFVNTHFHGDHVFGNATCGAQLGFGSEFTRRALGSPETWAGQVDFFGSIRPHQRAQFEAAVRTTPQIGISDAATIDLGGVEVAIEPMATGHTRGEVVVWIEDERTVFTGDLIFNGHWPLLWEDGDLSGWFQALDELQALGASTVVPGHGPAGGEELVRRMRECWGLLLGLARGQAGEEQVTAAMAEGEYSDWLHPVRVQQMVDRLRVDAATLLHTPNDEDGNDGLSERI